jgi:Rrf2 family protein
MKFSRSTTYGLRALANLVLAKADDSSRVKSLKIIAEEERVSLKFLEKLFSQLKRAGIVSSTRGANGGYYLNKKVGRIKLLEVLDALGEKTVVFKCVSREGEVTCGHSTKCGAVPVLQKVQMAINKSLEEMTLEDLV